MLPRSPGDRISGHNVPTAGAFSCDYTHQPRPTILLVALAVLTLWWLTQRTRGSASGDGGIEPTDPLRLRPQD